VTGTIPLPKGRLFLLPVGLSCADVQHWLPEGSRKTACGLRHFVVETEKTARARLAELGHPGPLRALHLCPLPPNPSVAVLDALLKPALDGEDIGLISDAGCPAVADPGAFLVARAHHHDIPVCPQVGPSSILLALMGSGLEGQRFAFHGYLPVDEKAGVARIRQLEAFSARENSTQICIETPYRNARLWARLLATLKPETRLAIGVDLTGPEQWIASRSVGDWQKRALPPLEKRPALFLFLA
jgi:16S rRNA (cytidine1402-2'-O)-methyltransferase